MRSHSIIRRRRAFTSMHSLHDDLNVFIAIDMCMFGRARMLSKYGKNGIGKFGTNGTHSNEEKNNNNEMNIRLSSTHSLAACATNEICRQMPEQLTTLLTHQFKFSIVARISGSLACWLAFRRVHFYCSFPCSHSSFQRNTHTFPHRIPSHSIFVSVVDAREKIHCLAARPRKSINADVQFYCNRRVFVVVNVEQC